MSDGKWEAGTRVRVLWGADEGKVGIVVGHCGHEMTAIRVEVPDGVLELTVDDVMLGPEGEGGGGVREPLRPVGPDDALGSQESL